jgi:hypothetical protein
MTTLNGLSNRSTTASGYGWFPIPGSLEKARENMDLTANQSYDLLRKVVSQKVHLWGAEGQCPFCGEIYRGFNIFVSQSSRKAIFHCRKCKAQGDVIDFVKRVHGYGFAAARDYVAKFAAAPGSQEVPEAQRVDCLKNCPVYGQLRADFDRLVAENRELKAELSRLLTERT